MYSILVGLLFDLYVLSGSLNAINPEVSKPYWLLPSSPFSRYWITP